MIKYIAVVILFFLGITFLFPQQTDSQKELLERATENVELLRTDREKAFKEAKEIEKEAQILNAREAELKAINTKCNYYRIGSDFENMMATAKLLHHKALTYKSPFYQLVATRFLFESYLFTGLPEKALRELELGWEVMNKLNDVDSLNIIERSNFFVAYSNYYLLKEEYSDQLQYIKLAGKELEKLSDGDYTQKLLAVHYSNLATSYIKNNEKDSAEHYAKLSQLKSEKYSRNDVVYNNLLVMGDVEIHKMNYEKALFYLSEAEKMDVHKNHIVIEEMYDNIIEANRKLERADLVKLYQAKKDSLKLSISENRNKSLHRLLNEKEDSKSNKYIYILLVAFVSMGFFTFYVVRKNRILVQQEKISQQYLEKVSANPSGEDYSNLLKVLKENDPAFMFYFEDAFPDFSSKLLQINPEISASETEFCALLKLRITTKEIAKYKFVSPKTVRNRKHYIRKRLKIPKEMEIYQWFSDL